MENPGSPLGKFFKILKKRQFMSYQENIFLAREDIQVIFII